VLPIFDVIRKVTLAAFVLIIGQINAEVMMKSDSELERDVKEEMRWNPDLDANRYCCIGA
jgi:hypothetical protein